MVAPTKLRDVNDAVQRALQYVGDSRLVELGDGETMDVTFLSKVKNARAFVKRAAEETSAAGVPKGETIEETRLVEQFDSDYYVGFGRRYKDVPVIGSFLVLRLDGSGKLAMVHKNWRRIVGARGKNEIIDVASLPALRQLVAARPELCGSAKDCKPVSADDIRLVNVEWGYMEAPSSYRQTSLRPGAVVVFKVGGPGEGNSQLAVALSKNVSLDQLWGRLATTR
jgi:hypothetical protein